MKTITYIDTYNINYEIQYDDNVISIDDLSWHNITEIKNIDTMVNLHYLDLSNNMITEIKNIDTMVNLQVLNLHVNQITEI